MTWFPLNALDTDIRKHNLNLLAHSNPKLASLLKQHNQREDIQVYPLAKRIYRCRKIVPAGEEVWVDGRENHSTELQAFMNNLSGYRPDQQWMFIYHCGTGHTLHLLQRHPPHSKPFVIVEQDAGMMLLALSLYDLTPLLQSQSVHWFIGDDAIERLEYALDTELFAYHLLTSKYMLINGELSQQNERDERSTNLQTVLQNHFQQAPQQLQKLIHSFKNHYQHSYQPDIKKRISVIMLQSGCWETLAQGLAEGFTENGCQVQTIKVSSFDNITDILQANLDVLRFQPDAVASIDYPANRYFFDLIQHTSIPNLVWYVDDVVNLAQGKHIPSELVFPVDPSLNHDFQRMHANLQEDIPLAVSANIQANYTPEFDCEISFVGSIFDTSIVRNALPKQILDYIDSIIHAKLQSIKTNPLELFQNNPLPSNERNHLIQVLRKTIAKHHMSDEFLFRFYFNLEFNRARRLQVVTALRPFQPKIYGSPEWGSALAAYGMATCYQGRYLKMQEAFDLYRSSKISLNIHSMSLHSSPNERDFEVPMCGGFVLSDLRIHAQQRIEEFFVMNDEIICYQSTDELSEKVDYYLANPDQRESISDKARARILKEHTFTLRTRKMLKTIVKD